MQRCKLCLPQRGGGTHSERSLNTKLLWFSQEGAWFMDILGWDPTVRFFRQNLQTEEHERLGSGLLNGTKMTAERIARTLANSVPETSGEQE